MWKLLNAGTGLVLTAWLSGLGPFAIPPDPHWDAVRADLAAADPTGQLSAQADALFTAGMPRPALGALLGD